MAPLSTKSQAQTLGCYKIIFVFRRDPAWEILNGVPLVYLGDRWRAVMSGVERTSAGLQMVIPGCERRTLPKSTTRVDEAGQGLLHFYRQPSLREKLESRADAPLRPSKVQKALPKNGLFSS